MIDVMERLFPRGGQLSQDSPYSIWTRMLEGVRSASGVAVTPDTAMQQATVNACVRVLAETLAQLPGHVYEHMPNNARRIAYEHPLMSTLLDQPNDYQTSFEYREMMQGHLGLRGNAYSRIVPGVRGASTQLIPFNPDWVRVERLSSGRLLYEVTYPDGTKDKYPQDAIFHLKGFSTDGICGVSPLTWHRDTIGKNLAGDRYAASMYKNSARPSGFLTTDAPMDVNKAQIAQKTFTEAYAGEDNWHKIAVMWGGLKWQSLGMTNEDLQYIETLKRGDIQICQGYRMPPHMVQILDRSTNNNIEQQSLEFVLYTMLPWIRRWEEAIARALITDPRFYFRFNLSGLLRGDASTRATFYHAGINNGWLCPNEVRELEDRDPYEGGEKFFMQGAMVTVDMIINPPEPPKIEGPAEPSDDELAAAREAAESLAGQLASGVRINQIMLIDAMQRMLTLEVDGATRATNKPNFVAAVEEFYEQHNFRLRGAVGPILDQHNALSGSKLDADLFALKHCHTHKIALLTAAECPADDLPTRVSACSLQWDAETIVRELFEPETSNAA